MEFLFFLKQFIQAVKRIVALLIYMLRTRAGPMDSKLIPTKENIYNRIWNSKVIVEVDVVDKGSETRFFTPRVRLVFAEWKQALNITPILY